MSASRDAAPRPSLQALLRDPWWQGVLLLACATLVILARAGAGPLANYDDAYYAEKAKQMLQTGDWLTPRFAGVERLDNPPLFLWLMAFCLRVFGTTSFAAVLPSAVAGIACVGLTYRLARALGRDAFESWAAGFMLLGTGYFLKYANHAMFDVFLTALFLGAMLAYTRAWRGGWTAWLAIGALTGAGVLTKSVLGLFPLIVIALHAIVTGQAWRLLKRGAWLAPLAAIVVTAPWYAYQLASHHEAFIREHVAWLLVQRGLGTAGEGAAASDPFGYVKELATTYWPWLPLALGGLWLTLREWRATRRTAADEFPAAALLVLWPLVVLGVLSAAHEKKLWYVMSVFPALALWSARGLAAWLRRDDVRARVMTGGFALAAVAGSVLALTPLGAAAPRRPDLQVIARAARSIVPTDARIVLMGGRYFSVAHQFVWASDRLLVPGPGDGAALRDSLAAGRWVLAARADYAKLTAGDSLRYPAVVSSGQWRLVCAAPAPSVVLEATDPFE